MCDQLKCAGYAWAGAARKVGISEFVDLLINEQPHGACCGRIVRRDPGLNRIQVFTVFGAPNDAPTAATHAALLPGGCWCCASFAARMSRHSSGLMAGSGSLRLASTLARTQRS